MSNQEYYHTQFQGAKIGPDVHLVIGLDFGTSSSKVVIGAPYAYQAYAVSFADNGHQTNNYLLPTRPFFNNNNVLEMGFPLTSPQFPALKMKLLDRPHEKLAGTNYTNAELSVGYLAETLRLSRKWFIENYGGVYGNAHIVWYLNLGIPSTGHKDSKHQELFKRIANAAWNVSVLREVVNLDNCQKYLQDRYINVLNEITNDSINIIPEVSAQVVGYNKSTVRQNGSHLLIDIGAGTVDICYFILTKESHHLLTSSVEPNGVFELHQTRIKEMKVRFNNWLENFGLKENPIEPIPAESVNYLPCTSDHDLIQRFEADNEYSSKIRKETNKILSNARQKRDPHSNQWETGIITFITGGGSQSDIYKNAINEVHEWWRDRARVYGLRIIDLLVPTNLIYNGKEYHRLSVAYGLSYLKDQMGGIISESDITDIDTPPERDDIEDRYPGMEQV